MFKFYLKVLPVYKFSQNSNFLWLGLTFVNIKKLDEGTRHIKKNAPIR